MVAVLPVRVVGALAVFLPLALSRRLRLTRHAAPMILLIVTAEVFGNAAYAAGASESLAIAAVIASQFGAVAAVAAFFLLGERLSFVQRSGVVAITVGVAVFASCTAAAEGGAKRMWWPHHDPSPTAIH